MAVWVQVAVDIVDHFHSIADALRNEHCRESHINQQRYVRMPDVMHSYPFYPDPFTYAVDLPVHIGICQRYDSIRLFQAINPLRVILDMVTQKVRNRDLSYTIFSFRRCGYILAVVSVESFGYVDNLFIPVDICRSECKSFPQTQAGII